MDINTPVADLVSAHAGCAPVLMRHHIDFCCQGQMSLADACVARSLDPASVLRELERAISRPSESVDPRTLSTPSLVAHLIDRHHGYLRERLPHLETLAAKVARVHGSHDARLVALDAEVRALAGALGPHLATEEEVLFPMLMARARDPERVAVLVEEMRAEHLEVGGILERIRAATDGFTPPEWGCGSLRALFEGLAALEADTLRHVHLENHVLAPRFA